MFHSNQWLYHMQYGRQLLSTYLTSCMELQQQGFTWCEMLMWTCVNFPKYTWHPVSCWSKGQQECWTAKEKRNYALVFQWKAVHNIFMSCAASQAHQHFSVTICSMYTTTSTYGSFTALKKKSRWHGHVNFKVNA